MQRSHSTSPQASRPVEAVRNNVEQFRFVMDHVPVFIAQHSHDRRYKFVNWPYARLFGLQPADLIGKHARDVLGEETYARASPSIDAVLAGQACEYDLVMSALPGGLHAVHVRLVPEHDAYGRVIGFLAAIFDISERKRAEDATRETQELFALFMRHSPIYVYLKEVTPSESRVIQASENFHQIIRVPGSDMAGKTMAELFPPEFAAKITADDWAVASGGKVLELEENLNGRIYHTIKFPLVRGDKTLLAGYSIDVTERKRAEKALTESQTLLQELTDNSTSLIYACDPQGRFMLINRSLEAVLGVPRESLIGKPREAILPPGIAAVHRNNDLKVIETLKPIAVEEENNQPDGKHTYLSVKFPIIGPQGNLQSIGGISTDITAHKLLEERMQMFSREILSAREREKKHISSILHHDLGSLAVGFSAESDAIEQELRSSKPGEALKRMKRLRKLFDKSLLRLKEVAVQLRPPELGFLGLSVVLRQHFSQVQKHTGVRIDFRESMGRRRLQEDTGTTLFRVAQEALTNAIRHGHAKQVDVRIEASKQDVTLTVHDNGKGFDLSERESPLTSRMGVRVMREMTVFAGGTFSIDSGPVQGTTVRASLPLETAAPGPGGVRLRQKPVARGEMTPSPRRGSCARTSRSA